MLIAEGYLIEDNEGSLSQLTSVSQTRYRTNLSVS